MMSDLTAIAACGNRIAELKAENERLKRLIRDRDALVKRAIEGSRVTAVSPLECLELTARATGLVDAQHRAEQAEAALAEMKQRHTDLIATVEYAAGMKTKAEAKE